MNIDVVRAVLETAELALEGVLRTQFTFRKPSFMAYWWARVALRNVRRVRETDVSTSDETPIVTGVPLGEAGFQNIGGELVAMPFEEAQRWLEWWQVHGSRYSQQRESSLATWHYLTSTKQSK